MAIKQIVCSGTGYEVQIIPSCQLLHETYTLADWLYSWSRGAGRNSAWNYILLGPVHEDQQVELATGSRLSQRI